MRQYEYHHAPRVSHSSLYSHACHDGGSIFWPYIFFLCLNGGVLNPFPTPSKNILAKIRGFCPRVGSAVLKGFKSSKDYSCCFFNVTFLFCCGLCLFNGPRVLHFQVPFEKKRFWGVRNGRFFEIGSLQKKNTTVHPLPFDSTCLGA